MLDVVMLVNAGDVVFACADAFRAQDRLKAATSI